MIGHDLVDRERFTDRHGRSAFKARCTCMPSHEAWYGLTLPAIYDRHQDHLDAVRLRSRHTHPSSRRSS
jgi:hypothetical protein